MASSQGHFWMKIWWSSYGLVLLVPVNLGWLLSVAFALLSLQSLRQRWSYYTPLMHMVTPSFSPRTTQLVMACIDIKWCLCSWIRHCLFLLQPHSHGFTIFWKQFGPALHSPALLQPHNFYSSRNRKRRGKYCMCRFCARLVYHLRRWNAL